MPASPPRPPEGVRQRSGHCPRLAGCGPRNGLSRPPEACPWTPTRLTDLGSLTACFATCARWAPKEQPVNDCMTPVADSNRGRPPSLHRSHSEPRRAVNRDSEESRPKMAIDSNSGGETCSPVIATRTGAKANFGLRPKPSTKAPRNASWIASAAHSPRPVRAADAASSRYGFEPEW